MAIRCALALAVVVDDFDVVAVGVLVALGARLRATGMSAPPDTFPVEITAPRDLSDGRRETIREQLEKLAPAPRCATSRA